MAWRLASTDKVISLEVEALATDPIVETLTCVGVTFPVRGGWAASGVLGIGAFAFSVTGWSSLAVPTFIAASGIMTGRGGAPPRIDLRVNVSSSADGRLRDLEYVLIPPEAAKSAMGGNTITGLTLAGQLLRLAPNPVVVPVGVVVDGLGYAAGTIFAITRAGVDLNSYLHPPTVPAPPP